MSGTLTPAVPVTGGQTIIWGKSQLPLVLGRRRTVSTNGPTLTAQAATTGTLTAA